MPVDAKDISVGTELFVVLFCIRGTAPISYDGDITLLFCDVTGVVILWRLPSPASI